MNNCINFYYIRVIMEVDIEIVGEDYGKDNCTLLLALMKFVLFDVNI